MVLPMAVGNLQKGERCAIALESLVWVANGVIAIQTWTTSSPLPFKTSLFSSYSSAMILLVNGSPICSNICKIGLPTLLSPPP